MTSPPPFDDLVAAGFDEPSAASRVELLNRATTAHRAAFATPPAWSWLVPGRIEIFGKHTDYAGGASLLAAVPRGFAVVATPREDGRVYLCNAGRGERAGADVARPDATPESGLAYAATVSRRLAANFPDVPLGTNITIASDLPPAAGLSSSSALVVGVAIALVRRAGIDESSRWKASVTNTYDLAEYLAAIERGSTFREFAGAQALGVFGGSEDHTAMLTCTAGRVTACRYDPVALIGEARMPDGWMFVIATSGVVADKAGSARDAYNSASAASDALLTLWRADERQPARSLSTLLGDRERAQQLEELAARGFGSWTGDALTRRLRHFANENARIGPALDAFAQADRQALAHLSRASQADAESLLRNQTAETSALAQLAIQHGAFAASSFGAGFGGSVWALIDRDHVDAFGARWVASYLARFPHRRDASWFAARPGPPVTETSPKGAR